MSGRIKQIVSIMVLVYSTTFGIQASPQDSVRLYTPQTKISTTPGQSLDYTITVINTAVK